MTREEFRSKLLGGRYVGPLVLSEVDSASDEDLEPFLDWTRENQIKAIQGPLKAFIGRLIASGLLPLWSMRDVDLSGADLSYLALPGADFVGANLSGADLYGADLFRANLSKANLSRANLEWANLTRTLLIAANLSGANVSDASVYLADLTGSDQSGVDGVLDTSQDLEGGYRIA